MKRGPSNDSRSAPEGRYPSKGPSSDKRGGGGGWGGGSHASGGESRGGDSRGGEGSYRPREFSEDRPQRKTFRRDDAPGATWGNRTSGSGGYGGQSSGGYRGQSSGGHSSSSHSSSSSAPSRDRGGNSAPSRPWNPPEDRGAPSFSAPKAPQPVGIRKLKEGIASANRALAELMEEFGSGILGSYDIADLEVPVSFDADGRFIGFGKGGAVTFSLTITPLEAENLFTADDDTDAVLSVAGLDDDADLDESDESDDASGADDEDDADDADESDDDDADESDEDEEDDEAAADAEV